MTNEEALFEIWFQLNRRKEWETKYPNEPFHEDWSMGFRDSMLKGWLARANSHVFYSTINDQGKDK